MPKYRVINLNHVGSDIHSSPAIAHIIEADSEVRAIKELADRTGVATKWFEAERVILSDADRHYFLQSE